MRYFYHRAAEARAALLFLSCWLAFPLLLTARPLVEPAVPAVVDTIFPPHAVFEPIIPPCGSYTVAMQNLSAGEPTEVEWFASGAMPSYSTDYNCTMTYPGKGSYVVSLVVRNAEGSDTLSKTIALADTTYGYYTQGICPGQTVQVGDQVFDAAHSSGAVLMSNATVGGCDSTVFVTLFLLPPAQVQLEASIFSGETYNFCSQELTVPGIYFCSEQSSVECDTLFILHLEMAVGLAEVEPETAWRIAPNPCTDQLKVDWPAGNGGGLLELRNAAGQVVRRAELAAEQQDTQLALADLPPGVYGLVWHNGAAIRCRKVLKL